ncbi:MAG: DUF4340 domain-containing protein [Planctomycetota bacterium]
MNLTKANLVLVAAAAVLAVPTWITLQRDRETFVDVSQVPKLFEGFTPDLVYSVVLAKPKPESEQPAAAPGAKPGDRPQVQYDQLMFQRTDQGFVLAQGMGERTGAPVNGQMLDLHVWKHLGEIPADRETLVLADASDEQLAEFGLDESHAFVVKAGNASGQVIAELMVGNDASQGQQGAEAVRGVFVRKAGSRDVVLYETPFWNRAVQQDQWIDRTVLKVPGDKVRSVTIANASGEVTFARPEGSATWTAAPVPDGRGQLRQIEVENMVQRFGFMQANSLLRPIQGADLQAMGLAEPSMTVSLTWQDGDQQKTTTLRFGGLIQGKNELHMTSSDLAFVLGLAAHFTAAFERPLTEYFDPAVEPAGTEPAAGDGDTDKDAAPAPPSDPSGDGPKDPGGKDPADKDGGDKAVGDREVAPTPAAEPAKDDGQQPAPGSGTPPKDGDDGGR